MPTAHKVLVRAGESALGNTSTTATATSVVLSTSTSDGSTKEISGKWSEDEHKLFLQGLEQHGRKWKKITAVVETRTRGQIKSHAQKYFAKLERLESAKNKETDEVEVEDESRARSNSSTKQISGRWSQDEHKLFLQGLEQHGREWKKIAAVVETRTKGQVQTHAQTYFAKLERLESAKNKETDEVEVEDESRARSNSSTKQKSGGWSQDEHKLFLQGLEQHGRKWKKIAAVVGTRTRGQIQSHAQKYFAKLEKLESAKTKTKERNELMFFVVSWDERFQQLVEYKEQNGHCRVPQKYKSNPQLGSWVNTQRQLRKKNKLSPEQKNLLEVIGFEWELRRGHSVNSWDERFKQLKEYKELNGHCLVPERYKANPQLGNWVKNQRQRYKKNKLLPKEIKSLEGIGFVWEPPRGGRRL